MYLYSMCIWRIFGSNPVSAPTGMIALRGRSHLSLNDFAVLVVYDILGCLSYLQLMYVLRLILWRYTQPSIHNSFGSVSHSELRCDRCLYCPVYRIIPNP